MMVVVVENAPPRLRGRLALWLIEARAGVYVGDYSTKTRERIWEQVTAGIEDGNAVLITAAPTEAGFEVRTLGPARREIIDADGLPLVRYVPDAAAGILFAQAHGIPALPTEPNEDRDV